MVYLKPVGIPSLMAWSKETTDVSIAIMQRTALALLRMTGGYLLDASDALGLLVAFRSPGAAVRWGLAVVDALLQADWPEELLEHEMGEGEGPSLVVLVLVVQHVHKPWIAAP